jgi:hypothetical protein
MKRHLIPSLLLLTACTSTAPQIKRLGPLAEPARAPLDCKIAGILPDSPADKAGLETGDTIRALNHARPANAVALADMIDASPADASMEVANASGTVRNVVVHLSHDKPRLGAACDLTGWNKNSVSAAGNESITVFNGPFAFTVSGIVDKGLAFMRVRISNHSDHPVEVAPEAFSVKDGAGAKIPLFNPQEVIYFMHGPDAVSMVVPPAGTPLPGVPADSRARTASPEHKKKADWTASDETYVEANAKYLSKESLWPGKVMPGKFADGLIYFLEPKALPVTMHATIEGRAMSASLGTPLPATGRMSQDELVRFFESQKKGTPVRLTLKKGKVFVGKFSSYDAINETVWFDTPSGVLLTTSSFGLRTIAFAEVISPDEKKQPAAMSN